MMRETRLLIPAYGPSSRWPSWDARQGHRPGMRRPMQQTVVTAFLLIHLCTPQGAFAGSSWKAGAAAAYSPAEPAAGWKLLRRLLTGAKQIVQGGPRSHSRAAPRKQLLQEQTQPIKLSEGPLSTDSAFRPIYPHPFGPPSFRQNDEFLHYLVLHASTVYVEDTDALVAWNCSRCLLEPVRTFQLTSLIIDTDAQLEAYVGVHHDKRLVVVCFRGTHSTYIQNWIDDLWAFELDANYPGVDHALVHRGFFTAYYHSLLRPRVTGEVMRLLSLYPEYNLALTGHSLGAALATLCSLDLAVTYEVPQEQVWLATFGSPRVGNSVFAAFMHKTLPSSVRVTHGHDIVVHLPPRTPTAGLLSYHHVAQEVWYHRPSPFSQQELYTVCDVSGEDMSCSRSVPGSSIMDHLRYLGVSMSSVSTFDT